MKYFILIVLSLLLASCMTDDKLNLDFETYAPQNINDGLLLSDPISEGIDPDEIDNVYRHIYQDENLWSIRSFLVFKNGKLIAESYMKDPDDIKNRHLIWSCTKQFIGVLTGIALEKKVFKDIDDPISMYFDEELESNQDKAEISIRNLLEMKSGIDFENDGASGETDKILRRLPENITKYILNRPLLYQPGTHFKYKDGDPQLLSSLIQKATGQATDEWADDILFSKIGFRNYNWVRYKDGTTLGGFGIETTPRELAKFALLVANKGKWAGEQLVSKKWIENMTEAKIEVKDGINYHFGYQWWSDISRNIHFMWGHGGQFAFIIPDKNMLVVSSAIPNTQGDYQVHADEILPYIDMLVEAAE